MVYQDLLKSNRNKIDILDSEIIYLLSKRFQIVEEIGNIKKQAGINALQPNRWESLMRKLLEEADDKGVSKKLVEDIWNLIHAEALKKEQ